MTDIILAMRSQSSRWLTDWSTDVLLNRRIVDLQTPSHRDKCCPFELFIIYLFIYYKQVFIFIEWISLLFAQLPIGSRNWLKTNRFIVNYRFAVSIPVNPSLCWTKIDLIDEWTEELDIFNLANEERRRRSWKWMDVLVSSEEFIQIARLGRSWVDLGIDWRRRVNISGGPWATCSEYSTTTLDDTILTFSGRVDTRILEWCG